MHPLRASSGVHNKKIGLIVQHSHQIFKYSPELCKKVKSHSSIQINRPNLEKSAVGEINTISN